MDEAHMSWRQLDRLAIQLVNELYTMEDDRTKRPCGLTPSEVDWVVERMALYNRTRVERGFKALSAEDS